jgi:hypothetical protein
MREIRPSGLEGGVGASPSLPLFSLRRPSGGDGIRRGYKFQSDPAYLRKASCRPPSTVITWPVVLLNR